MRNLLKTLPYSYLSFFQRYIIKVNSLLCVCVCVPYLFLIQLCVHRFVNTMQEMCRLPGSRLAYHSACPVINTSCDALLRLICPCWSPQSIESTKYCVQWKYSLLTLTWRVHKAQVRYPVMMLVRWVIPWNTQFILQIEGSSGTGCIYVIVPCIWNLVYFLKCVLSVWDIYRSTIFVFVLGLFVE